MTVWCFLVFPFSFCEPKQICVAMIVIQIYFREFALVWMLLHFKYINNSNNTQTMKFLPHSVDQLEFQCFSCRIIQAPVEHFNVLNCTWCIDKLLVHLFLKAFVEQLLMMLRPEIRQQYFQLFSLSHTLSEFFSYMLYVISYWTINYKNCMDFGLKHRPQDRSRVHFVFHSYQSIFIDIIWNKEFLNQSCWYIG